MMAEQHDATVMRYMPMQARHVAMLSNAHPGGARVMNLLQLPWPR